jgi:hypothetical protein
VQYWTRRKLEKAFAKHKRWDLMDDTGAQRVRLNTLKTTNMRGNNKNMNNSHPHLFTLTATLTSNHNTVHMCGGTGCCGHMQVRYIRDETVDCTHHTCCP